MNCQDAARILNRIQVGTPPEGEELLPPQDGPLVDTLLKRGLINEVSNGNGDDEELAALRAQLADVIARRRAGELRRDRAAGLEGPLRTKILDLAERQARTRAAVEWGHRRVAVTYAGRSLLSALMTRQERVGSMELDDFERQMGALRASLSARASKAALILKELSPLLAPVDEIHLRTAAVGLAARAEEPKELARSFNHVFRALGQTGLSARKHPLLSELVVVTRGLRSPEQARADVQRLVELRDLATGGTATRVDGDDVTAAAVLFAAPDGDARDILAQAADLARKIGDQYGVGRDVVTPWVLVASQGFLKQENAVDWIAWFVRELANDGVPYDEQSIAASILVASRRESGDDLIRQFKRAHGYLTRLSPDGMVVPAAMLALLPSGIEETLDDLRMACSEIAAKRLSLAGMENLSLGVKLLVQSAVMASGDEGTQPGMMVGPSDLAALAPLGVAALALVLPTAMAALYVFHEVTVHQHAVENYAFHPVHTHFIYG